MKEDDSSIDVAETLYWRAPELPLENWTIFDEGREQHRVRSGAFVWNEDGMSCYMQSVLASLGLDWRVIKNEPRNGVLSVVAGNVRQCGLGVAADPDPDYIPREQLLPRDKAHALIVVEGGVGSKKRKTRCRQLALTATIVHWGDNENDTSMS